MAKKTKLEESTTEVEVTPNFNKSAATFFKDTKTGLWTVGRIKFDKDSLVAEPTLEVLYTESSRELAQERFKIFVAKEVFE